MSNDSESHTADQQRADNRLLALALLGATPDHNTQTSDEVSATELKISAAINRALPGLVCQEQTP